ncbi:hypothetical protein BsIDN1_66620 [Bacillus safensis]|uniref:Uncharacterized protein n=1 Tax=Bacillus safensis TaxID=561879 RepID=A0A5S9MLC2_BACIA|nr:hypothetical protein BsIDN1_66620 [Bacillus safensis]
MRKEEERYEIEKKINLGKVRVSKVKIFASNNMEQIRILRSRWVIQSLPKRRVKCSRGFRQCRLPALHKEAKERGGGGQPYQIPSGPVYQQNVTGQLPIEQSYIEKFFYD